MKNKPSFKFKYNKLRGRIREICGSEKAFCAQMPCCESRLSLKFHGKTDFTQSEIFTAMKVLEIPSNELCEYFFCLDC